MSKDQLDRMEAKLDLLDTRLDKVDLRLEKYNAQLEYHIQRTDALEVLVTETQDEVKPIVAHVEQVRGAVKLLAFIAALAAFIESIKWLWSR